MRTYAQAQETVRILRMNLQENQRKFTAGEIDEETFKRREQDARQALARANTEVKELRKNA